MTFYQLECFIAAAQELSFVAAAKKLITTQPVITYQIGTLEKEMGCQLFDRSKRRVSLTAAGVAFYEDAQAIVADCRRAVERAQAIGRRERGRLRIGIRRFSNYGDVSEMIRQLGEDFPDVHADMIVQSSFEPLQNLRTGATHVSYLFDAECEGCDDIAFEPLYPMHRYMLMRDDHRLAQRESAPLEAFRGERLILPEDPYLRTSVLIPRRDLQNAGIDITLTSSSFEGAVIMIQANMGIVMIEAAPQTRFPGLAAVRIEDYPVIHLGVAWRKDAETPQIRAWLDIVKETSRKKGLNG